MRKKIAASKWSKCREEDPASRIDMIEAMPEPPAIQTIVRCSWGVKIALPSGPNHSTASPGLAREHLHSVTAPSGFRLTPNFAGVACPGRLARHYPLTP